MIPITDAIGMLGRLAAAERAREAERIAGEYPIVQLVRIAPHVSDPIVLAMIAYTVQRRATARDAFEAFVVHVDDETLFIERGAQPLTIARVLATMFSDDEVLAALHENALGIRHVVAVLHCIHWSSDRVVDALARRGFLPFGIATLTRSLRS